jgi:two-component system nitrogen regulation response regulator NtrX
LSEFKPKALIIDDEPSICESLGGVLSDEGWDYTSALSGVDGIRKCRSERPDLIFLDVWMKGIDGVEVLQKIREFNVGTPIVIMSGHANIDLAVRVTKLGAFDFLEKPLTIDKLLPIFNHSRSAAEARWGGFDQSKHARQEIIGDSPSMNTLRKQIEAVAPRNAWVLITGENGTGKEVVARSIHNRSMRVQKPFIAINCAAIPEELIESELFGHVRGAFTNAVSNKKGKFELAHGGTLFLDEIGDMSLRTQAKVLRILQEKQFERVGDSQTISVDVRVIAATNKNLETEISEGNFREDLFYRLNVVPFHLAPLRERDADIIQLANYFLRQSAVDLNEIPKRFSDAAASVLRTYSWPGNVRELRNIVERVCVLSTREVIEVEDLPPQFLTGKHAPSSVGQAAQASFQTLREARSEFERVFILEKLEENEWNVSKTAESIGIERSNLHRKLRAYELDPKKLKGI